jgi:hypothetical protein
MAHTPFQPREYSEAEEESADYKQKYIYYILCNGHKKGKRRDRHKTER